MSVSDRLTVFKGEFLTKLTEMSTRQKFKNIGLVI
jgi:hypothetical protein